MLLLVPVRRSVQPQSVWTRRIFLEKNLGNEILRPCERWNIPTFVFLPNSKHVLFLFRIFRLYGINHVKIKFLIMWKNCTDSNSDSNIWLWVRNAGPYVIPSIIFVLYLTVLKVVYYPVVCLVLLLFASYCILPRIRRGWISSN